MKAICTKYYDDYASVYLSLPVRVQYLFTFNPDCEKDEKVRKKIDAIIKKHAVGKYEVKEEMEARSVKKQLTRIEKSLTTKAK